MGSYGRPHRTRRFYLSLVCHDNSDWESVMVKSNSRTETLIETHEVWVVRRAGKASAVWCPACSDRTVMLTPEEAARLLRIAPRTIYRWVETGQAHFREIEDGWLLICLASLPAVAEASPSPMLPGEPPMLD